MAKYKFNHNKDNRKTLDWEYVSKLGKVIPTPDKIEYRNQILTELFHNGVIQQKVKGLLYRKHVAKCTLIYEDLEQEVFMWLCKRPCEEIIEMYEDNPARLVGLSVRIAVMKGVAASTMNPDYPKHSLVKHLLYSSNLQGFRKASEPHIDLDNFEDEIEYPIEKISNIQIDDEYDKAEDNDIEMSMDLKHFWDVIYMYLDEDDLMYMEEFFQRKKNKKWNKKETVKYKRLLYNISVVIDENNLQIEWN